MTFTIKHRGVGLLMAEYSCPEHGVFEAIVERDAAGDAPVEMRCPASLFVDSADDCCHDCAGLCDRLSPRIMSAPKVRKDTVLPTALVKGGDTERRPGMLDTRPLADGMPMKEWKKLQKGITEDRRHKQLIKKGLKSKRIQVG